MSTIIDQLNRRLKSDLHEINHESLNSTFVGYSNLYRQSIFVKQFAKEQGYYTEKMVTNQLNDRVLGVFSLNNTFILVLKDCSPKDIGEKIDSNLAFEMGQVLGEYHLKVKPFIRIKLVNGQFDDYLAKIDFFKESSYKRRLKKLTGKFLPYKKEIKIELSQHSKFVLHGDVGLRNYKYVDSKLALIDFEKARLGPVYQDFIKLFYQDFGLNEGLIQSFLKGYSSKNSNYQLSDLTRQYLVFTTAIGIFNYTEKIEDLAFRHIGETMLDTIEKK